MKFYHLSFDGNLSDQINSVTLFQDGPSEQLTLLGLQPQATHRSGTNEVVRLSGNASLDVNQWMHLFYQVDEQEKSLELYLNGSQVAEEDLGDSPLTSLPSKAAWTFGSATLPLVWMRSGLQNVPVHKIGSKLNTIIDEVNFHFPASKK